MEIMVCYKGNRPAMTYQFAPGEVKRFSADYRKFLKTGTPEQGAYNCILAPDDLDISPYMLTTFRFEEVANIVMLFK